ncbi:hypothetical protein F2Q69_00063511 [Brassica cretica]|uniref:Uncharacterized protein n=1 Tax=Brassica cretica TaxID=69181 RepID=A0A8S9RG51_BRACR|nr:hypothetical protein F2Q69_00063511 [Brassica cretica]
MEETETGDKDMGEVVVVVNTRLGRYWLWYREWFKSLMKQGWSWNRPALEYLELYHSARK